jgi:hypothetical protein
VHGPHVDDAAALLAIHLPQGGTGRQERPIQMDGEQLLPFCELKLDQRGHDLDAGVADQDVESFERLRHAGFNLFLVAHVHGDAERTLGHRIDLGGRFLRCVPIKICDDDLCARWRHR